MNSAFDGKVCRIRRDTASLRFLSSWTRSLFAICSCVALDEEERLPAWLRQCGHGMIARGWCGQGWPSILSEPTDRLRTKYRQPSASSREHMNTQNTQHVDEVAPRTPERTPTDSTDTKVTPTRTIQRVNRYRNQFHAPSQLGAAPKKIIKVRHNPLGLLANVALMKESCLMYEKFKIVCENCKSGPRQGKRCKMLMLMKKRDHEGPSKSG